ncbi:MAG TPA: site-2 protease family protein [Terriglobales bacterium]|nr:site-2 protease family protein [Terriglobales bacterium]
MRNWSLPIGRMFGAEIRIHVTFLLVLLFVWFTEAPPQGPVGAGRGLALVGIILGSVLIHELVQAAAGRRLGVPARAIILLPIGGLTLLDEHRQAATDSHLAPFWKRDLRTAAAGLLASLAVAAVFAAVVLLRYPQVGLWRQPLVHSAHLLRSLFWCNLFLVGFNLLPAYPLDGGRVLRALFARRLDMLQATRDAVSLGQGIAILMMFAGMVWSTWLVVVGVCLFIGAQLEERSVMFHSVLQQVRLEEVMLTDFATLSPGDTLEDALHKAVHCLQDDFPVIRGSDMVGVISKQKILQALRSGGNSYVQSAMSQVYEVGEKGESLSAVFHKITQRGLTLIPVVEDQRLVGIVTLQNLTHSMGMLSESRSLRQEE